MEERVAVRDQAAEPGGAAGHHPAEWRDDPGEVVVALRLLEGERCLPEIQLDPLRVGLSDHTGTFEGALPLCLHDRVGVAITGLGQGDFLVGALQPREELAGCHPGAQVRQNRLHYSP